MWVWPAGRGVVRLWAQSSWDTQPVFLWQPGTGAEAFVPALMPLWLGGHCHPSLSFPRFRLGNSSQACECVVEGGGRR